MAENSNNPQNNSETCFLNWLETQQTDLNELLHALNNPEKQPETLDNLIDKTIRHFSEYIGNRTENARNSVCSFFNPTWNSSLENSLLWLGGCRPSIFIRLVYVLSGSQLESYLSEYIRGIRRGNLGDLSARQLNAINELQARTIREEEKLTSRLASLQENVADKPICTVANERDFGAEMSEEVNRALENHEEAMFRMLREADNLRLETMKDVIGILTAVQAVEFLAAGKKLHLCVHEWCKTRDLRHD